MNSLIKFTRIIFNKFYQIEPYKSDLLYECDGRIIRSLSDSKKKVCGAYIFDGLKK